RPEGHHAVDERASGRLHLRRPPQGKRGAALDALLSAAKPERGLFGGAHVESRGDVSDRQASLPDRANAVNHRPGRGRHEVTRLRTEAPSDATLGDSLPRPTRMDVLAGMTAPHLLKRRRPLENDVAYDGSISEIRY